MKTWSVRHTFTCQFGIETLMSHYLYRFISSSEMRTRLWGSQTNFNSSMVQFELTRVFEDFFPVDVSIPVRCNLNLIAGRSGIRDCRFNSSKVQFELFNHSSIVNCFTSFNSSKVQFERSGPEPPRKKNTCFNSSKVQFERNVRRLQRPT